MRILLSVLVFFLSVSPAWAVVTQSSLTVGSDTGNASSYTTASVTPSANQLVFVNVVSAKGAGPATTPTISGNGLTYVQIDTQLFDDGNAADDRHRITSFRSMGASPSAGAITIDFGGVTQTGCSWSVVQFDGVDTSGTNGSGAVVQSAKNVTAGASSLTVTLAAFASADNGAASGFGLGDNLAMTPDTGWTEMHEQQVADGADSMTNETQWRNDNDTTAAASWTGTIPCGGIAIEIKVAAVAGGAAQIF